MSRGCTALVLFLLGGVADGQEVLHTFHGTEPGESLGVSVAAVGDLDGDGIVDLASGAYRSDSGGFDSGKAYVWSGASHAPLLTWDGPMASSDFGFSIAGVGDVDEDGVSDVAVGARWEPVPGPFGGSVRIFSGADGALLYHVQATGSGDRLGYAVAGIGDIDGDGVPDVGLGATLEDTVVGPDTGRVRLVSGASGVLLRSYNGSSPHCEFGNAIAFAGDVNGDGVPDHVIGARREDSNGKEDNGSAWVLSGLTGKTLRRLAGDSSHDRFGSSVAGAGDPDGDGVPDVAVGARFADVPLLNCGSVEVLSGSDGSTIHFFPGVGQGDEFGVCVENLGDVDGDGVPDLGVGAFAADQAGVDSGTAAVYSGATGELLHAIFGDASGDSMGTDIVPAGDQDGDGVPDLFVGARWADGNGIDTGLARIVRSGWSPFAELGGGTEGVAGVPHLSFTGTLQPRSLLEMRLEDAPPLALAFLFTAFSSTPTPLVGGTLHAFPIGPLSVVATDANGELAGEAFLPEVPSGTQLWFQAALSDESVPVYGASLSNGVKVTFP